MSVPYEKRQKNWIEKHSVQIGDRVYVMQKYDPKTRGDWEGSFLVFDMYQYVGKTGTIARIEDYGVQIDFGDGSIVKYWFPYSVLRKEKEMKKSYEERQAEWAARNDIKIGDPVRLIRVASYREDGWPNVWPPAANEWVGKTLEVLGITGASISCYNPEKEDWFAFPYFVLEKVKHEEKEMKKSYEERQDEWIKKNDLKIGDRVRVIRKAESDEDGWSAVWAAEMDAVVGKAGVVKRFLGNVGIRVSFDKKFLWSLPYFVLEKVVEHTDKEWEVSYGLKVKTGDPVLMRDDETSTWRYSVFSHKHSRKGVPYPYYSAGILAAFCIPYKGNEHLTGTTDAYVSEKKESPKFVFGAKVKATLSCGDEIEGVLIGFDEEDDDTPFEVVVQDEDASFNYTTYWVKSVTYID